MMSDEEKLAAKFYLKNPEFRKAVNDMYKKKAVDWAKGKKSATTKVSPLGYAKRAASYMAKIGIPTAVMTAAMARGNTEVARRSGQGHHVRVLDVALTGFNQSRAVMNRDPAAFYRATMAGVGAPIGRRAVAAITRYADGGRLGAVVNAVRGQGEAVNNYMRGGAFAPNPVAVAPRGIGPAGRVVHARMPQWQMRDAINARRPQGWQGTGDGRLLGGAPPEGGGGFSFGGGFDRAGTGAPPVPGVQSRYQARQQAIRDFASRPQNFEMSSESLAKIESNFKARQARDMAADAITNKGRMPWMDEHLGKADKASNALLNHGNNKSDLANHLNHGFDFVDNRPPPTNPGRTWNRDGTFTRAPKGGEEQLPPDTGLGGKWGFKRKTGPQFDLDGVPIRSADTRGIGEGLGFEGPGLSESRNMESAYDRMRGVNMDNLVPAANQEMAGATPTEFGFQQPPPGSVSSTPRGSIDAKSFGLDVDQVPSSWHAGEWAEGANNNLVPSGPIQGATELPPIENWPHGGPSLDVINTKSAAWQTGAAAAKNQRNIGEAVEKLNRGTTIPGRMVQKMIDKGGTVGKLGNFIAKNGRQIGGAFSIAGGALAAAGIVYGGVQLHKMHEARAQLRSIATDNPEDQQIQEFFKVQDEETKRNDVYFGLNTFAGSLAIGAGVAGGVAAFGAGLGFGGAAAAAGVAAGPIGWAALGIGGAIWAFTSLFESGAKKRAYREYMQKVYGSSDHPSLDYYLDHKDPGLLKAVNSIKDYKVKDDATDEFKAYMDGLKGDIGTAEAAIKVEEGVDDPRRAQLANIMNGTVPAGELDKTSDFISRQHAQDVQNGHGPSQTWDKDDIVNHAKKQFHSDQDRYAHRGDPNLGPDLVNQTEQDKYDDEDRKNGTETHRWGYGGRSMPGAKQEETPETDVL